MKTCLNCNSTAFDDMTVCYGCLQPFGDVASRQVGSPYLFEDEELLVEEPAEHECQEQVVQPPPTPAPIRLHVSIPDLFGYDIYLYRVEGMQLTVGCARDNNIVLPHTESKRHLLRLYYLQGQVWVEDTNSAQQALVDGIPLTGTRCLKPGAVLKIGEATIEIVEE